MPNECVALLGTGSFGLTREGRVGWLQLLQVDVGGASGEFAEKQFCATYEVGCCSCGQRAEQPAFPSLLVGRPLFVPIGARRDGSGRGSPYTPLSLPYTSKNFGV